MVASTPSLLCPQLAARTRAQQAEDGRPLPLAGRRGELQLQVPAALPLPPCRAALCGRQEGEEEEGGDVLWVCLQ